MASISISELNYSFITDLESHELVTLKGGFGLFDLEQFPDLEAVRGTQITEDLWSDPTQLLEEEKYLFLEDIVLPDWEWPVPNSPLKNRIF